MTFLREREIATFGWSPNSHPRQRDDNDVAVDDDDEVRRDAPAITSGPFSSFQGRLRLRVFHPLHHYTSACPSGPRRSSSSSLLLRRSRFKSSSRSVHPGMNNKCRKAAVLSGYSELSFSTMTYLLMTRQYNAESYFCFARHILCVIYFL